MSAPLPSRVLHIAIARSVQDVYRFASDPENMPKWASGLGRGIRHVDGKWYADTPEGKLEVRFAPANDFGVLDHEVVLPSGASVFIPMRAVANGDGCELTFVLFRQPEMSEEKFDEDAAWVTRDLEALKALLEA
ncbi:SRPBCC family protein [Herbaspirillum sp. RV1423]|uniref:SRPBCC family protein n=1 Tax=Herbaspirillum sp. RV1423 TaxID=1443993 RepID=UPI0004BA53B0|nr:SRPBCC family protein [Herbaspirillum sp. RV1423]